MSRPLGGELLMVKRSIWGETVNKKERENAEQKHIENQKLEIFCLAF